MESEHFTSTKNPGFRLTDKNSFPSAPTATRIIPVGYALPASAHYRDAKKLRDTGFTSYRCHYPQDPAFMDACDELGILGIVSNPGWQFMGDEVFKERVYQNAKEMIRRDRNHACVLLGEAQMNETDNSTVAAELYRIVHQEYPGEDCYTAGNHITEPSRAFTDGTLNTPAMTAASYYGYASGATRSIIGLSNRAVCASPENGARRPCWCKPRGTTGPWIESMPGSALRRRPEQRAPRVPIYGPASTTTRLKSSALLWFAAGLFRLPKLDYYLFQSQRPVDAKGSGSGPMVFIANFASFHSPTTVTVFSNCERLRLIQNGKEVATQKPDSGYHLPHPEVRYCRVYCIPGLRFAGDIKRDRIDPFTEFTAQIGELPWIAGSCHYAMTTREYSFRERPPKCTRTACK